MYFSGNFSLSVNAEQVGCADGEIRLVGGQIDNEGVVEICFGGTFASLRSSDWDVFAAAVVCRELRLPQGKISYT